MFWLMVMLGMTTEGGNLLFFRVGKFAGSRRTANAPIYLLLPLPSASLRIAKQSPAEEQHKGDGEQGNIHDCIAAFPPQTILQKIGHKTPEAIRREPSASR